MDDMPPSMNELLARVDERTRSIQTELANFRTDLKSHSAYTLEKIEETEKRFNDKIDKIENGYVTKDQFVPVQKIVFGLTGLILICVVGAIIATVVTHIPSFVQ